MTDPSSAAELRARTDALGEAYAFLMQVVGYLAFLLAPVVVLFDWAWPPRLSISAYFHSLAGGYFAATLGAVALFLLSYEYPTRPGYETDRVMSNIGAVGAAVVAVFPTKERCPNGADTCALVSDWDRVAGAIHLGGATLLFVVLALFCLYQFTKTGREPADMTRADLVARVVRPAVCDGLVLGDTADPRVRAKRRRNRIYRMCGWTMVATIVLSVVNGLAGWGLLYWFEAVAITSFGVAWLVKSSRVRMLSGLADPVDG